MKIHNNQNRMYKAQSVNSESGLRLILAQAILEILIPKVWTWGTSSAARGDHFDTKSWW